MLIKKTAILLATLGIAILLGLSTMLKQRIDNFYWRGQLENAIQKDNVGDVEVALRHKPDLKGVDAEGDTLLMLAARRNSSPVVNALLHQGASVNARGQYDSVEDGDTPLIISCRNNSPSVARSLVEGGADVNARGGMGITALMVAVRYSSLPLIELLLRSGAQIAAKDDRGFTVYNMLQKNNGSRTAHILYLLNAHKKHKRFGR